MTRHQPRLDGLEDTYRALSGWREKAAAAASIQMHDTAAGWALIGRPHMLGACGFVLLFEAQREFTVQIEKEIYARQPVGTTDFFVRFVEAVEAGRVVQIEYADAATGALTAVESKVSFDDGWAWVGERRLSKRCRRDGEVERHIRQFLRWQR